MYLTQTKIKDIMIDYKMGKRTSSLQVPAVRPETIESASSATEISEPDRKKALND